MRKRARGDPLPYRSLADCVSDLEAHGKLIRISEEVDPYLEMAAIHRRVYEAQGPALYFEHVKGSGFPAVSNLFGTLERSRFIFRHTLESVKNLVRFKADPASFLKSPLRALRVPLTALTSLPLPVWKAPVLAHETTLAALPQIVSWPGDGGPFILLPQVYTENPDQPGILRSNLGMYRIQIAGNDYEANGEAGLHYQIRRDIGIHHAAALRRGEPLKVSVFVGGSPAHAFASVMYLPEGLSEILFAGALAGRGFRYTRKAGHMISAEADFCITGTVMPGELKPEGPFGDHLGYYSLRHDFPVLKVEKVYHRTNAIWPFTVVGRPQEILTLANALLGYGPCALAKFLWIAAGEDDTHLDVHDVAGFFRHMLERVDWSRDLHFQTATTMDTLDYSGTALNEGSKVVIAAAGAKRRSLSGRLPEPLRLIEGFSDPAVAFPGALILKAPAFRDYQTAPAEIKILASALEKNENLEGFPLIVLTEDSRFCAASLNNFLWVTFTRTNPSHDVDGVRAFNDFKHWGCRGSLIFDARLKPHHAPPVTEDLLVSRKVDLLASSGKSLHGII
jgi:4-hydroxy-3-polyprenylbenzoate decarboxylase